jgi:hypothetical protein
MPLQRKLRELQINLMAPVWVGLGIYMACTDRINWWVLTLIMLSHIKLPIVKRW